MPQNSQRIQLIITATALSAVLTALVAVSGCQAVPVSNRSRVMLLTSEAQENELGLKAYQDILSEEPVTENERYRQIVQRVGQRIAAVADRPDFEWQFEVIESDVQNAFCLPGGKVAIYTGILPICESEAGLAVVMSHEIAHAIARHGGERMQHQMARDLGARAVTSLFREEEEKTQKVVQVAYNAGTEYLGVLPYSRKHELEADQIGLVLLAKAGYDPSEAPVFWERFGTSKGSGGPIEWMSTHPSDARRAAALREQLPEALHLYRQSAVQHGIGEKL